MNQGKFIFAQLTDFLPRRVFDRLVEKFEGNKHVRSYLLESNALYGVWTANSQGQHAGSDVKS